MTEAYQELAKERNIELRIETIETISFEFTPDALEKIILNILSNAIKYTQQNGLVAVSAKRSKDGEYVLRIKDTGIGIAEDKIERVFERFHRVDDDSVNQVNGSGIGLALVKSLVESHNGQIKIESSLSKGTEVIISLPIIKEVESCELNTHRNQEIIAMELMNIDVTTDRNEYDDILPATDSSGHPTVLIVEDNHDMLRYIVDSIQSIYTPITARNGEEGYQLAIKEVPDLIISDVMMPKMNGYQTTRALRENPITNHIPIVLLTAKGDRTSRLKGWQEKADDYITKPFDIEELRARLSNLINIRNILKRRFSESAFEPEEKSEQESTKRLSQSNLEDRLHQEESNGLSSIEKNTRQLHEKFIETLNTELDKIYMKSDIVVSDVAQRVNMSERQFSRKLVNVIDMTPSEYIRRFRLEKSKNILRQGKSVTYTALEVGFSSQAYFGRCFKAQYRVTPKQFLRQEMGGDL